MLARKIPDICHIFRAYSCRGLARHFLRVGVFLPFFPPWQVALRNCQGFEKGWGKKCGKQRVQGASRTLGGRWNDEGTDDSLSLNARALQRLNWVLLPPAPTRVLVRELLFSWQALPPSTETGETEKKSEKKKYGYKQS